MFDQLVDVPDNVAQLLAQFKDMMPLKLPQVLPPRRVVNQKIKLVAGVALFTGPSQNGAS